MTPLPFIYILGQIQISLSEEQYRPQKKPLVNPGCEPSIQLFWLFPFQHNPSQALLCDGSQIKIMTYLWVNVLMLPLMCKGTFEQNDQFTARYKQTCEINRNSRCHHCGGNISRRPIVTMA